MRPRLPGLPYAPIGSTSQLPQLSQMKSRSLHTTRCCWSHYTTLQVSPSATKSEVKTAFHKLSKRYHPDSSSPHKSTTKFAGISEAYNVLSDDTSRRRYDQSLSSPSYSSTSSSYGGGYSWDGLNRNEQRRQSATYAWNATRRANDRMKSQYASGGARSSASSQQERDREAFEETARRYARMHERSSWGSSARLKEDAQKSAMQGAGEAVSLGKKIGQIVSVCFLIYLFAVGTHVSAEELDAIDQDLDEGSSTDATKKAET